MRIKHRLLPMLTLLAPLPGLAQGPNMSPKENIVLTDKEAFGLMPPELVAASGVKQAMWSPDGQYVLLVREEIRITPEKLREMMGKPGQPPPGQNVISIWDRKERRLTDVWKRPTGMSSIGMVQWLPGSTLVIANVGVTDPPKKEGEPGEYHDGIIRISAASGAVKIVTDSSTRTSYLGEHVSPVDPIILFHEFASIVETSAGTDGKEVRRITGWKNNLILWREFSGLSAPIPLPPDVIVRNVSWTQDGAAIIDYVIRGAKPATKLEVHRLALNVKSGRLTPSTEEPRMFKPAPDARPVRSKQVRTSVKEGDTSRYVPFLWLESVAESQQPRAMVAANSEFGVLSPKSDAVLYVSHGAAWMTPLFRMSKEEFLAALEASERMVALSKAKQLGLGLLMYSQDYDEVLPGPDGVNGKITPYLKDDSLFEGFVYTFGGGPLSGIESPSETELGYVNGPGGRAIIYVDGHAKWRSDK